MRLLSPPPIRAESYSLIRRHLAGSPEFGGLLSKTAGSRSLPRTKGAGRPSGRCGRFGSRNDLRGTPMNYAEALFNRGATLRELRRFEEALASYDRALAGRPDYAEALSNRRQHAVRAEAVRGGAGEPPTGRSAVRPDYAGGRCLIRGQYAV